MYGSVSLFYSWDIYVVVFLNSFFGKVIYA